MESTATSLEARGMLQRVGALVFTDFRAVKTGMWLFLVIGIVIAYLVLPPLFFILYSSVTPSMEAQTTGLTLANYTSIFESTSRFNELIWNSMVFSAGSAAWALDAKSIGNFLNGEIRVTQHRFCFHDILGGQSTGSSSYSTPCLCR
jgi:ABC-type glycerol-3-phosphate transport system permease component